MVQAQAPKRCWGQCTQEFPQVFKREFTRCKQASAKCAKASKNLQKKFTLTFNQKFVGLPLKETQTHAGCKVHAKVTTGGKSKVPAALAHRLQKKQQKTPNTLKKTYWKVFFSLFGEVVVIWEDHSNRGELCTTISGASSEGCAQQQREAKSQGKSKPKGK